MIQVVNNKIVQYTLPKTGALSTGETISGYHLLDKDILTREGWLPLEDNPPEYDIETQYLIESGYEILKDKVVKKYKIEEILETVDVLPQIPSEIDMLKLQNEILLDKQDFLEDIITEMILTMFQ